jgi:hypothetical protein
MPSTISGVALDHVAVAVERWSDAWPRYASDLGGRWASGGTNVGFAPAQLGFSNGGRIEILQPWETDANPFLRRFLDRRGPGPHHLTFKVPDLVEALETVRARGLSPVGVELSDPMWKEAFIHPRQATGIVVQLAQSLSEWQSPPPEGFPSDGLRPPAAFVRTTHVVAELDVGLALFEELLGGHIGQRGQDAEGAWEYADLTWTAPPTLRLVAPLAGETATPASTDLRGWLGELPGRLHHLVFAQPATSVLGREPTAPPALLVPGVLPEDGLLEVIEPHANLGTRVVIVWDRAA